MNICPKFKFQNKKLLIKELTLLSILFFVVYKINPQTISSVLNNEEITLRSFPLVQKISIADVLAHQFDNINDEKERAEKKLALMKESLKNPIFDDAAKEKILAKKKELSKELKKIKKNKRKGL